MPALPAYAPQHNRFIFRLIRYFLSRRFPLVPTESYAVRQAVKSEWAREPKESRGEPGG